MGMNNYQQRSCCSLLDGFTAVKAVNVSIFYHHGDNCSQYGQYPPCPSTPLSPNIPLPSSCFLYMTPFSLRVAQLHTNHLHFPEHELLSGFADARTVGPAQTASC